jgi:hypothetical protein
MQPPAPETEIEFSIEMKAVKVKNTTCRLKLSAATPYIVISSWTGCG